MIPIAIKYLVSPSFQGNSYVDDMLKKGTYLRYRIYGYKTNVPSFLHGFWVDNIKMLFAEYSEYVSNASFIITLHRNYEEYIRAFSKGERFSMDYALAIGCNYFDVYIKVLDRDGDIVKLNLTLIFYDGFARAGKYYPLPQIDSRWREASSGYIAWFKELLMHRIVYLNLITHELYSSGEGYGEWIFTLSKTDLKSNIIPILYSLNEAIDVQYPVETNVSGIAELIVLDKARQAVEDFRVGNHVYQSIIQIYNNLTVIPFKSYISGLDADAVETVKQIFLNEECYGCKYSFIKPILRYSENRLIIYKDIFENLDLGSKPWRYIPELGIHNSSFVIPNSTIKGFAHEYIRGIEYDGNVYVALGLPPESEVSYGSDGLLLYIKVGDADPLSAYPSILTHLFGFTIYTWSKEGGIYIKLLETNLYS